MLARTLRGYLYKMSVNKVPRRSASTSSLEERIVKRRKIELPPLTAEDYKNGVVLAPMVRSGTSTFRSCIYLNYLTDGL